MSQNIISTITPGEAYKFLGEQDYILLDVRSSGEFSAVHATPAINLPLHSISPDALRPYRGKKIICICEKGGRGKQAAHILTSNGFTDVYNINGGTKAWVEAELPILRGQSSISIERQVRIAAGSLVILGIVGGYFLTPYSFLISLFVGSGLVFSGITNTCGMALLLARCPWNSR